MAVPNRCPCGTGEAYPECCGRFHGGASAPTAELLMRSRFSAFAINDVDYLNRTWHSTTRPQRLTLDKRLTWTRLEIENVLLGGPFDASGVVEFCAHYRLSDSSGVVHERSSFAREDRRWYYVGGDQLGA